VIVIDTSAVLAVLFGEPERLRFMQLLARNEVTMSAGSAIEASSVIAARSPRLRPAFQRLLDDSEIGLAPVDAQQVRLAEDGLLRFGKGRRAPPAVLNFGDLFAYALARQLDAPLLYKGDDFSHTDVRPALTV
jgi:ribonuclease VapC